MLLLLIMMMGFTWVLQKLIIELRLTWLNRFSLLLISPQFEFTFRTESEFKNPQSFSGVDFERRQERRKVVDVASRVETDDAGVRKVGQLFDVLQRRVANEDVDFVVVVVVDGAWTGQKFFEDAAKREQDCAMEPGLKPRVNPVRWIGNPTESNGSIS